MKDMQELKLELGKLGENQVIEYTKGKISLEECGENLQAIAIVADLLGVKPRKPLRLRK